MKDIIVLGTGGKNIVRLIEEINESSKIFNLIGFLEKDPEKIGKDVFGYPIIGNDDLLLSEFRNCGVINNIIATTRAHFKVTERLKNDYGITDFPNLIHPSVDLKYNNHGEGNIIYNDVQWDTDVKIGSFNIMNPGTSIGHETIFGDCNLTALNVTIGARCTVGDRNVFANASTLSLGLSVGSDNMIGVGSVVIEDVGNRTSLLGNPAKKSILTLYEWNRYKTKKK